MRLEQARVVGEVCLQGAAIGQDTGAVAVSADGLWADGDVDCTGLMTRGAVSMQGLQVTGSLLWLALLLTAGSVIFTLNPPPPLQTSAAPHFNAVIYTLDLLLPVVDLGQKYAFKPAGAAQWFAYFLTGAGWVLATTVAAGAARILSRR